MYTVERREVTTIKNYHGRPGYGREVRWYILRNGEKILEDSHGMFMGQGIYYYRKKDALEEIKNFLEK